MGDPWLHTYCHHDSSSIGKDRKLKEDSHICITSHLCITLISSTCLTANVFCLKSRKFISGPAHLPCCAASSHFYRHNTRRPWCGIFLFWSERFATIPRSRKTHPKSGRFLEILCELASICMRSSMYNASEQMWADMYNILAKPYVYRLTQWTH